MRLFCIPHAGGFSVSFHPFGKRLAQAADVVGIELAGRGVKAKKALYRTFREAVYDISADIADSILKSPGEPYMILGHSMGSWLAYEVYYQLEAWGIKQPKHIFFSGNNVPPNAPKENTTYDLPEEEFVKRIMRLGYTNAEIFADTRFRKRYLPYLRSDLRITECYAAPVGRHPLKCHISVLYGKQDPIITEDPQKWTAFAEGECRIKSFGGGHFFIFEQMDDVAETMKEIIERES